MNRYWRLDRHPDGNDFAAAFSLVEGPLRSPADGEVLVRNQYLSLDAGTRLWMTSQTDGYQPPLPLGESDGQAYIRAAEQQENVPNNSENAEMYAVFPFALYGIGRSALGRSGPSVVSINGVVASLGVTEFMATVAGLRPPHKVLTYYGHMGRLTTPAQLPDADCYYCKVVRGQGDAADVQRYLREGIVVS